MNGVLCKVQSAHRVINGVRPLRWLTLLMAVVIAASVMWSPADFANAFGGLHFQLTFLIVWATCSGVIYGVGFFPKHWCWQILFTPYVSILVLAYILLLRFC